MAKKSSPAKNTVIGKTASDPFFDDYAEEALVCRDIIDMMGRDAEATVTLCIYKDFLGRMVRCYTHFIKDVQRNH